MYWDLDGRSCLRAKGVWLVTLVWLFILFIPGAQFSAAQEMVVTPESLEPAKIYSPFVNRNYPDRVLFGDTHFHTNLSFDAGLVGTSLDVDAGYRFARGEKVRSNSGQPVQLIRPLDFLVITDHAELIGLAPQIQSSAPELLADPWGKWVHERFNAGQEGRMEAFGSILEAGTSGINPMSSNKAARSIWIDFVEKAETYNEPGRFTAMTGFEWSSTPSGNNHERIYDVTVSDGRQIGADGRAREPVGSSVDIENATFTNTIGDALMAAYWRDPDFDPDEHAFYYVRVLEIPTPRWTTYDAAFFGIERPSIVPATVQDRAYTSPI